MRENFPDPHVIVDGDTFYAYATNGDAGNMPVIRSTDLRTWEAAGDAMPELASWVFAGRTWAPGVIALDDSFIAFYTAAELGTGLPVHRPCRSPTIRRVPSSTTPTRHWSARRTKAGRSTPVPSVTPTAPCTCYWKNDGNCCGLDTWLYGQRLADDGLSLTGEPVRLLVQDAEWEGNLIEAPFMWRHDDQLYLFYSANAFDSSDVCRRLRDL